MDNLRRFGRNVGQTARDVEFLNRRGGLLPQIERSRGNLIADNSFYARFKIDGQTRQVRLKVTFHKASIL